MAVRVIRVGGVAVRTVYPRMGGWVGEAERGGGAGAQALVEMGVVVGLAFGAVEGRFSTVRLRLRDGLQTWGKKKMRENVGYGYVS